MLEPPTRAPFSYRCAARFLACVRIATLALQACVALLISVAADRRAASITLPAFTSSSCVTLGVPYPILVLRKPYLALEFLRDWGAFAPTSFFCTLACTVARCERRASFSCECVIRARLAFFRARAFSVGMRIPALTSRATGLSRSVTRQLAAKC